MWTGREETQEEIKRRQRKEKLAGALAQYFNIEDKEIGPCACLGASCGEVKCPIMWSTLLSGYEMYFVAAIEELKINVRKESEKKIGGMYRKPNLQPGRTE